MRSIQAPWAGERVAFLSFSAGWPRQAEEEYRLILEAMGRHSNLILADSCGLVVAPLKPVPPEASRVRPMLPGLTWFPPPSRPGIPVEEAAVNGFPGGPIRDVRDLVERIKGLSPWSAGQILSLAGSKEPKAIQDVLIAMAFPTGAEKWYCVKDRNRLHLTSLPPLPDRGVRSFDTFFEAAWAWKMEGIDPTGGADRSPYLPALDRFEARLQARQKKVQEEERRCSRHDNIRRQAEALAVALPTIPRSAATVVLPDPSGGPDIEVQLDPAFLPRQNVERLFAEARRLKRGLSEMARIKKEIEKDVLKAAAARSAFLSGDPEPAKTLVMGILSASRGRRPSGIPRAGRRFEHGGFIILVGKNAKDNDRVTFAEAAPWDLWMHARDYPGSHVVVLSGKRPVPDAVVRAAALLAAANSSARNETAPEIMITERKWVRRLKGGKPGQVTVERFRTIRVRRETSRQT